MLVVCVGALLPWAERGRSGILGDGRYALLLGAIGLMLFALARVRQLDLRWWRLSSLPLTVACLALSASALKGHGALGALVTAAAALTWLVISRRVGSEQTR
jgi:hypothetical protein